MRGETILGAISGVLGMVAVMASMVGAQAPPDNPVIMVYVSAPTRDGFIDTSKDVQDTVNDLRKRVSDAKMLGVAEEPATADVILTVVERGVGSQAFGERVDVYQNYYGGASLMALPVYTNTRWISTCLKWERTSANFRRRKRTVPRIIAGRVGRRRRSHPSRMSGLG